MFKSSIYKQISDPSNKDVIIFLRENNGQNFHEQMLNDIFETDLNFVYNKIHVFNRSTVRNK